MRAVVAFSLAASASSLFDIRLERSREEGRDGGCSVVVDGSAVDLELEVVGPALRWETGCRPGR